MGDDIISEPFCEVLPCETKNNAVSNNACTYLLTGEWEWYKYKPEQMMRLLKKFGDQPPFKS